MIAEAPHENPATPDAQTKEKRSRRWAVRLAWWIVPLLSLVLVGITSYTTTTARRYPSANAFTGELLKGQSVGQSFVARYSNLSGIELRLGTYRQGEFPARASVVLHLRSYPTPGPDLATARLSAGEALGENPWHLFSFPPIADSQDKDFYIEVESPDGEVGKALTFFWWQRGAEGDPYPYGTAYRDGKAQSGDLAFGLRYSPSPTEALAQVGRAASPNFPPPIMLALALAGMGGALWAVLRLPAILRDTQRLHTWLRRWSLPVALSVALLNGLLYMLLLPPWQGPDEHMHFGYVAALDRYDLDVSKARAAEDREWTGALTASVGASMDRHNFSRNISWHSAPGAPANPGPSIFGQIHQPPAYYLLSVVAVRAARALGVEADAIAGPGKMLLIVRGVSLALSLGVVALAWAAGALLGGKGSTASTWLRLLLPLTVTLLPMHASMAAVANNDILSELAASSIFVALVALFRWPTGLRGIALAALTVALTIVAASTNKGTVLAASVPLLGLGLTVWLGMLVSRGLRVWRARGDSSKSTEQESGRVIIPLGLAACALLLGMIAAVASVEPKAEKAVGWNLNYYPVERAARVRTADAHDGSHVVELRPSQQDAAAGQTLVPPIYHPELKVTVSGWARALPGASGADPSVAGAARLTVVEGSIKAGGAEVALDPADGWTFLTATARISQSAERVTLNLVASGRPVQFDSLTLGVEGAVRAWDDPIYKPKLQNPSAEIEALELRPLFAKFLPNETRQAIDAMLNPQPFDKGELWRYYLEQEYESFWGNFGWVSLPLPRGIYSIIGVIIVAALIGLAWLASKEWERWPWTVWLGLVTLAGFAGTVLISLANSTKGLAYYGIPAYPQGRYLFVLTIPLMWLLISGLGGVWSAILTIRSRGRTETSAEEQTVKATSLSGGLSWGVWLWLNLLFFFTGYCLLALIAPYYYG